MQQQHFDLFMARFSGNSAIKSNALIANMNYNTPGNYSSIVANAMSAVAAACKQQTSLIDPNSGSGMLVLPESITFKTPKSLAEIKVFKERQSKVRTTFFLTIYEYFLSFVFCKYC